MNWKYHYTVHLNSKNGMNEVTKRSIRYIRETDTIETKAEAVHFFSDLSEALKKMEELNDATPDSEYLYAQERNRVIKY